MKEIISIPNLILLLYKIAKFNQHAGTKSASNSLIYIENVSENIK